jgi:hypothetical protein
METAAGFLVERLELCEGIRRVGGKSLAGERDIESQRAIEKLVVWNKTELPARHPAPADAVRRFEALAVWMPLLRDFGGEGSGGVARTEVGCEE